MSELAGINIEDLINVTPLRQGGEMLEPKVEQLTGKLRRLQQGKRALEEEIKEIKSESDILQKELTTLQVEAYKLEGTHKEKEEWCRKLQFQCEESEQEAVRMKFENQLLQLIAQHKNLHSVFTPEMLPDEIESAENTTKQLLSAEQMKLAQLHRLYEKLEEMKKQRQPATTAAEIQEGN
ncbi:synaptonemal complex central element protein 1-like isoform X3 [Clinocottus analis]|uniref:synaptonemal complex central element protein 1-like isoform X3 n=1 Tax=Clinocottus analis TaxID=304258 RepID=UPI0035C181A5